VAQAESSLLAASAIMAASSGVASAQAEATILGASAQIALATATATAQAEDVEFIGAASFLAGSAIAWATETFLNMLVVYPEPFPTFLRGARTQEPALSGHGSRTQSMLSHATTIPSDAGTIRGTRVAIAGVTGRRESS
jgi:hypothetical protein